MMINKGKLYRRKNYS